MPVHGEVDGASNKQNNQEFKSEKNKSKNIWIFEYFFLQFSIFILIFFHLLSFGGVNVVQIVLTNNLITANKTKQLKLANRLRRNRKKREIIKLKKGKKEVQIEEKKLYFLYIQLKISRILIEANFVRFCVLFW